MEVITGDCFDELEQLEAESIEACVTDPPYGLAFMGRDWDDFEPSKHVDNLANVECRDCGEEFIRESYDCGDFPAGEQQLKNSEYEVVARVQ